ncbi:hypothetical protein [Brevibacillus dissolubilis]|uniref:hypothetical protein n=1 Tax=Brevibacillus dissolubilis TaxID=1844116 RepID=UPI0011163168|nr:hypothetical protein [Brevibacillus dissolubilis]
MKIMVLSLKQLIWGSAIFAGVLIAGFVLLVSDPLDVSSPYQNDNPQAQAGAGQDSVPTSSKVEGNQVTANPFSSEKPTLALDVTMEGNKANIKMLTDNFTFINTAENPSQEATHGQGHAHLYVDGQLLGQLYDPEFILSKLPKGEHEIKVELVYSNHLPYKVESVKMVNVK